jgi:hypothetical protein
VNPPAQLEDSEAPMTSDELTQRKVHRLALRPGPGQALRFGDDLVVDV